MKVVVAVPSLIVLIVCVDVKHHLKAKKKPARVGRGRVSLQRYRRDGGGGAGLAYRGTGEMVEPGQDGVGLAYRGTGEMVTGEMVEAGQG